MVGEAGREVPVGRPLRGLRRTGLDAWDFIGKSERGRGGLAEATLPALPRQIFGDCEWKCPKFGKPASDGLRGTGVPARVLLARKSCARPNRLGESPMPRKPTGGTTAGARGTRALPGRTRSRQQDVCARWRDALARRTLRPHRPAKKCSSQKNILCEKTFVAKKHVP
jgi:hypothetical protein